MADWSEITEKGIKFLQKLILEYRDRTVNFLARADKETFKKIYDNRVNQDEGRRSIIEMAAEKRKWKG